MKHVKAFTHEPKIPGVRDGTITQTIRPGRKIKEGDYILYHGWTGRPYRSPWSWRLQVLVTEVVDIDLYTTGRWRPLDAGPRGVWAYWHKLDDLAHQDGIADGQTMGEWFNQMYVLPVLGDEDGAPFQIIRLTIIDEVE